MYVKQMSFLWDQIPDSHNLLRQKRFPAWFDRISSKSTSSLAIEVVPNAARGDLAVGEKKGRRIFFAWISQKDRIERRNSGTPEIYLLIYVVLIMRANCESSSLSRTYLGSTFHFKLVPEKGRPCMRINDTQRSDKILNTPPHTHRWRCKKYAVARCNQRFEA